MKRMMKQVLLPSVIAVLLAASASGTVEVGAATHLVEARMDGLGVVVFLPVDEILSPEDATNYLLWAESTFPHRLVKAVWETDPVALPVTDTSLLSLLRKGDKAVDPSGRNHFVVDSVHGKGVSLRLDRGHLPGKHETTPELCLTNAWILPRDALFEKWRGLLASGVSSNASLTRQEMRQVEKSAVCTRNGPAGKSWREELAGFTTRNPGLMAGIEFRNGTGTGVWVRVRGERHAIDAGGRWTWKAPSATANENVRWEVRGCGSETCRDNLDEDWDWGGGMVDDWSPLGEDVVVDIKPGDEGSVMKSPIIALPKGAIPCEGSGNTIKATLIYRDPESPVEQERLFEVPDDSQRSQLKLYNDFFTRRIVVRLETTMEGWETGVFTPSAAEVRPLLRGDTIALEGAPMKKKQKPLAPWGKLLVHVERNGHGGDLRLEVNSAQKTIPADRDSLEVPIDELVSSSNPTGRLPVAVKLVPDGGYLPAGTNIVVARGKAEVPVRLSIFKPAPPWPGEKNVEAAKKWLSQNVLSPRVDYNSEEREKFRLLGFRPLPEPKGEAKRAEETVDRMADHIRECRGCGRHGRATGARAEALRILGWGTGDLEKHLSWPSMICTKGLISGTLRLWWRDCEHALSDDWVKDPGASLLKAKKVWNGDVASDGGAEFAGAFVHFENCQRADCKFCKPFSASMKGAGADFEARRRAFFRALMLNPAIDWKAVSKPDSGKVDKILALFSSPQQGKP